MQLGLVGLVLLLFILLQIGVQITSYKLVISSTKTKIVELMYCTANILHFVLAGYIV